MRLDPGKGGFAGGQVPRDRGWLLRFYLDLLERRSAGDPAKRLSPVSVSCSRESWRAQAPTLLLLSAPKWITRAFPKPRKNAAIVPTPGSVV